MAKLASCYPLTKKKSLHHAGTSRCQIAVQFDQEEGAALSFDFEHYISSCCPIANISALELCINSSGHVYGALVLHLLEVYTLIKRLKVDLCKFQVIVHLSAWFVF